MHGNRELIKIHHLLKADQRIQEDFLSEVEAQMEQYREEQVGEEPIVQKRYELFLEMLKGKVEEKRDENIRIRNQEEEEKFGGLIEDYLLEIDEAKEEPFVFIFSGTAEIQEVKANRPIRIAKVFGQKKIHVFYSYWRWHNRDMFATPRFNDYIFQSPIDLTMKHILQIIKYPFQNKEKIFILGMPYPAFSKYIETLRYYGWKVIYDIRDDWEEFNKRSQAKWYKKEHEIYAIKKSDYVTAVSKTLVKKFAYLKPVQLVPNALDSQFDAGTLTTKGRNKIGYVGHLTAAWIYWDAMMALANALPYYTIEIIGHSMPLEQEMLPANLHYLGAKPAQEVIECMKEWKVGLIPFTMDKLTAGVDPIKVYEYLAMQLKVVSFIMPQIHDYPEVKIVDTIEGFIEAVKSSMLESFDEKTVQQFLKENTWENRIDTFLMLASRVEEGKW